MGAVLPEVGFPALPAAWAELLEPVHAARARAVYDECLVAAYDALPVDRLLERADADRHSGRRWPERPTSAPSH